MARLSDLFSVTTKERSRYTGVGLAYSLAYDHHFDLYVLRQNGLATDKTGVTHMLARQDRSEPAAFSLWHRALQIARDAASDDDWPPPASVMFADTICRGSPYDAAGSRKDLSVIR